MSDVANLDAGDIAEEICVEGGSEFYCRVLNAKTGAYMTDFPRWDFSSKPVSVGTATQPTDAMSFASLPFAVQTNLNSVASINLTQTGQTTLYTVPAGKTLINAYCVVQLTGADTVVGQPTVSVGVAGSYIEIDNLTQLDSAMNQAGMYQNLDSVISQPVKMILPETSVVRFNVGTGATAVGMVATVHLFGMLI